MGLVGETDQRRSVGGRSPALQQVARPAHPNVNEIGMGRQADLGTEDADQVMQREPRNRRELGEIQGFGEARSIASRTRATGPDSRPNGAASIPAWRVSTCA